MSKSLDSIRYLTPHEAATRLMVSPVTLRHWALAGKLAFATTPGGHRRFAEDEVERFAAQHQQTATAAVGGVHRILVVDDNVQLVDCIVELLQRQSESVAMEIAYDGFEAGQKLLAFQPHTVLLDLMMPGLNGFEVCRKIKESPETQGIRVVMMTGYHTPENMSQALGVGADACLPKPLDKTQLLNAIVLGEPGVTDALT